ncbi:hypothetical protein GCM10023220_62940 [Streptomyces ziwulingensis]|uniref:Uncharacterized protein n=1 Tax=Streptomyces ziwulingensis TaxID=1045501 RepID=A0ABP9CXV4_9ACTN
MRGGRVQEGAGAGAEGAGEGVVGVEARGASAFELLHDSDAESCAFREAFLGEAACEAECFEVRARVGRRGVRGLGHTGLRSDLDTRNATPLLWRRFDSCAPCVWLYACAGGAFA